MAGEPVAILKTTDLDATIDWYQKAGFRLQGRQENWCQVERDGVVLQFLAGETPWPEPPTFTGTIYLYPESIDHVLASLSAEVTADWGPEDREWGTREVGLRDPNGYYLTFSESLRPNLKPTQSPVFGPAGRNLALFRTPTSGARAAHQSRGLLAQNPGQPGESLA